MLFTCILNPLTFLRVDHTFPPHILSSLDLWREIVQSKFLCHPEISKNYCFMFYSGNFRIVTDYGYHETILCPKISGLKTLIRASYKLLLFYFNNTVINDKCMLWFGSVIFRLTTPAALASLTVWITRQL